jgi:Ca2+-binding RTX toxin-like protein
VRAAGAIKSSPVRAAIASSVGAARTRLPGGKGPDRLRGQRDNDELAGNRGDDHLNGGGGFDIGYGGIGSDTCRGVDFALSCASAEARVEQSEARESALRRALFSPRRKVLSSGGEASVTLPRSSARRNPHEG